MSGTSGSSGTSGQDGSPGVGGTIAYCGAFFDTTLQPNAGATAANLITINSTDFSNGVSVQNGSQITISNTGTYDIQFSIQFEKQSGGDDNVDLWLRKNGLNVPDSNTRITFSGNPGYTIAAWNFLVEANSGDYYQLYWSSADTTVSILSDNGGANPTRPDIPGVIISVAQVTYTQIGPTGATGPAGSNGTSGTSGSSGTSGLSGTSGTSGSSGPAGSTGATGPVGGADTQVIYNDGGAAAGDSTMTFNKSTKVLSVSNVTVSGTTSNVTRRAYGLVAFDTGVTLDEITASVTSSTSQLKIENSGSWQGTGWTETFAGGGTPTVQFWINLPINSPGGYANASGALNTQGHGCRCVISDQTPSAKSYQITVVRSGTSGNMFNISVQRLV